MWAQLLHSYTSIWQWSSADYAKFSQIYSAEPDNLQTSCAAFFSAHTGSFYTQVPSFTYKESLACFARRDRRRERERRGGKAMYSQGCSSMLHTPWRIRRSEGTKIQLYTASLCCPRRRIYSIMPPQTVCHSPHTTHTHTHASDNYDNAVCTYCLLGLIPVNSFFFQSVLLFRITHD